jgi:Zn-dependent metalloprotease
LVFEFDTLKKSREGFIRETIVFREMYMHTHRRLFQVVSTIVIVTVLFSSLPFAPASAQGADRLKREINPQTGKISFIGPETGQTLSASKALGTFIRPQDPAMALAKRFGPEFGLKDPQRDLKEMKFHHSEDGRITARYQQHYQGIPVMGGELIVNTNGNGDLYSMNGEVSPALSLSVQPNVSSEQASQTALQAIAKWYQKTPEDFVASESELWIYDESLLRPSTRPAELVWRLEVTPKDASMPIRELVLVNARRDGISLHFNQIDTAWQTPKGITSDQSASMLSSTRTELRERGTANNSSAHLTPALLGANWHVAPTGSDSNSCSSAESPCGTINGAIGKASNGDTIKLAIGTYTGTDTEVVLIDESITLSGGWNTTFTTQSGQSTIDGQGARGAVRVNSGVTATIERMVMQNGNGGSAAGIFNLGMLTINSSAISNNDGTGIYNYFMGTVVVINSTIDNNTGGGILNAGGAVMNNVTISGNGGTGLYNTGDGTAIFNNSTISDNTGLYSGGMVSHSGIITLKNTIVAGNSSTFQDQGPDCIGPVLTAGYNLIGNSKDCEFTPTTGDLTDIDPRLGTLIGSPGYHPLQGISPAIDAGNPVAPGSGGDACLGTDARGITRPVGERCDIGAYEYDAPGGFTRIFVYSGDGQYVRPGLAFPHPLQVIMLDGQNKPVPNASVTFTAPASGSSGTFAATGTRITTVVTDANGIATTSTFTANTVLGAYTVVASATDVASVDFPLHNGFWTVAPTGSDTNDCLTPATPCATINGAIGKASDGDTIYVSVGVFQGEAANVKVTKRLTILGGWDSSFMHQAGFSILDGHGTASHLIQFTKDSVVERLILRNGGEPLSIECSSQVTLRQSSITGMSGSIVNCGILSFVNSTISNNRGGWGAILNHGTLTIQNSTIVNNATTGSQLNAGGINNSGGSVTIQNSILYGNLGPIRNPRDCDGLITSAGHNMIGTTINCKLEVQASDQVGIDPKLGPLLSNGYHPLFSDSPAINAAASCSAVDQRGIARPQGDACDIGAYEYMDPGALARLEIVGGNDQRAAPRLAFAKPFQVAALDGNDNLIPGISVIFQAPNTGASGLFADTSMGITTAISDANGIATAPLFTANGTLGAYMVAASAAGPGSVEFSLENFAFYVAITGNDSNSCLVPSAPCATIQAAVDKAVNNDTVLISAGTYFTMVHLEKGLTLSGGWNRGFTSQTGLSTLDGQRIRPGVYIETVVETTIDRFIIRNGRHHSGGAIYANGLNIILTVTNSLIHNNQADSGGGIFSYGTLTLINTTVSYNRAGYGGGIDSSYGTLTLSNSTISNNWGFYGGGIRNEGKLTLNNTTVTDNSAYYGGGIGNHGMHGEVLKNSIVARNSATGSSPDCYGSLGSAGYNLIGNNSGCTFAATTGDKVGTETTPIDPFLSPLQPNGGLHSTHAPFMGSPAIDAGNPEAPGNSSDACFTADQRGVPRPVGIRCDIGAFEGSLSQTYVPLVSTYTADNDLSLPGVLVCNQTDPNCTAGDPHAQAAHRNAIGISNLYASHYDRNSINNSGMTIVSTVHYDSGYDNAFWSGEQMVYGDAYGFPLADDVAGHELTHGVTQHESNLFYYYQSGAINESFSDLWGEFYDQTNGQGNDAVGVKWQIGEDISGLGALRDMRNPAAFSDPDKISSPHYYEGEEDSGGIHTNSGVNNKAFFLMVDGGSFNGKTVTALGWTKTAAIYYEANSNLLSSGADYSDLYYALQQACKNLLGQKGITVGNCSEVKDAIDAVEMNGQPAPHFNTDAPYCPGNLVPLMIFSDDFEAGTGNWMFYNSGYPRWQWDSLLGPYARSGNHSLYADDYPPTITDAFVDLFPSIHIPENAYLRFDHAYGFETGYNTGDPTLHNFDGGVLEYNILGGNYGVDAGPLIDHNGYDGALFAGAGNPLAGRSAFVGSSHGYISTRLNLAPLAGESIVFRWRMGLDEAVSAWGWWVDNVKVYTCVSSPNAFNKSFPSNGGSGIDLSTFLWWNSSLNAEYYEYCYDVINDNQCNRTWNTAPSFSVGISNLGTNTTYYWQVRAVNGAGITYADNQSWNSFTTTDTLPVGWTEAETFVSTNKQGKYSLEAGQSLRESYTGVNNGPAKLVSTTSAPLMGSERFIYRVNGVNTSFSEMMGLPDSQLDNVYWLPWYNNVNLDTQLRFANTTNSPATVTVTIGGVAQPQINLAAGESTRISYPNIDAGPVKIESTQNIVAAERVIYNVNGVNTSFSEMMALPEKQLDNTYWLPWYNNINLDTQLRFANVSNNPATVTVTIGGTTMPAITLAAGQSTRISYPNIDSGPVKIQSTQPIVASERVIYKINNIFTSFSEMMALPNNKLNTTYWLPWYNNIHLDTQLRIANVSANPATVMITIGGVAQAPINLAAGASTRVSYPNIDSGPVKIQSTQTIVAAERVIYKVNNVNTSFSEMMALPDSLLSTLYWFPWYNNVNLDTQLRFGVP